MKIRLIGRKDGGCVHTTHIDLHNETFSFLWVEKTFIRVKGNIEIKKTPPANKRNCLVKRIIKDEVSKHYLISLST